MTDAFNAISSAVYAFTGHASASANNIFDVATAHPILAFQIVAVISVAVIHTGSQIR